MENQWWFASQSMIGGFSQLKTSSYADGNERQFKDASKISVIVEGGWVRKTMDRGKKNTNDLVIASKHLVGDKPIVDKLHFLKKDVEIKDPLGPFFHQVIYATNDFRESVNEIQIQLRIYDEDGLSKKEQDDIQAAISVASTTSAIAFPQFAPIAGLIGGVGPSLVDLVNNLDKHDKIIDTTIKLSVNKPDNGGYKHLQPGFFVCFSESINAENIFLGDDLRLYVEGGKGKILYDYASYLIIRISRDFHQSQSYIIDERSATLLHEIESSKSGKAGNALYFLRDTMNAYSNFRKLERYSELKAKHTRTAEEDELFNHLSIDPSITPYIN